MDQPNQHPSLTDGLDVQSEADGEGVRARFSLDGEQAGRRPIDAGWSKRKKTAVAASASLAAALAVGGGIWFAIRSMPPGLPSSADEAIAVINSARFDRLDADRQRQYLSEAERLLRELPEDERRALREDEDAREAMRRVMSERFNEMIYAMARGEQVELPFGRGPRPGAPRGERPEMSDEEREQRRSDRRERMTQRITSSLQEGNAQRNGLIGEFFQKMRPRD